MVNFIFGALTAIAGYISKYLIDYHLLKAPRLRPEILMRPGATSPPHNAYRKYGYTAEISMYNFSENAAYNFNLLNFTIDKDFTKEADRIIVPKTPINSSAPLVIQINYIAHLRVTQEFTYMDAKMRLVGLNRDFKITYSFQNALGKNYNQTIRGTMNMVSDVGQIKSDHS
jgi:hypothetical protein